MQELQTLIGEGIGKLREKVIAAKPDTEKAKYLKQYNPKEHDVFDKGKRRDKFVKTDNGDDVAYVNRLPIPLQQIIVNRAATFLTGNPIELEATPENETEQGLFDVFKKVWRDNKLDFESGTIAKVMMAETEAAEVWYVEKLEAGNTYWKNTPGQGSQLRLRCKVLSSENSSGLYPVFNIYGDMISFCRSYKIFEGGKEVEYFDIYTDTFTYYGKQSDTGFIEAREAEPNSLGKIPVIYYSQAVPEWHNVQELIDRLETQLSNHADTNDYSGSPLLLVWGEIKGFAKKGEQGKLLNFSGGKDAADAKYLVPENSIESIKLELDNLRSLAMDMTDTPDISFSNLKGLGDFSGIALKLLFMGAHMKAASKMGNFGKSIQRRINLLIHAIGVIIPKLEAGSTITIDPKFEYYLPKNVEEAVNILTTAVTGGILSKETAVGLNPLVSDPEAELERLKEEENSPAKLDETMNQDN